MKLPYDTSSILNDLTYFPKWSALRQAVSDFVQNAMQTFAGCEGTSYNHLMFDGWCVN